MSNKFYPKKKAVEAFILEVRELNWPQWAHDALTANDIISHNTGKWTNPSEPTYLDIRVIGNTYLRANLGDYVVRDWDGRLYPLKAEKFLEMFEPAMYDQFYEFTDKLHSLLVCTPIADPSEILETAYKQVEATLSTVFHQVDSVFQKKSV